MLLFPPKESVTAHSGQCVLSGPVEFKSLRNTENCFILNRWFCHFTFILSEFDEKCAVYIPEQHLPDFLYILRGVMDFAGNL